MPRSLNASEPFLEQTYGNWELIIVDDGSTDNSAELIREFNTADARIKPIYFAENQGALPAFHAGFEQVSGDLFFGIAADDFLVDATFFESVVKELNERPSAAGVFARCRVVDAVDLREMWTMGSAPTDGLTSAEGSLEAFFENSFFAPGASAIWRLPLVKAAGGFDSALGPQADFFLNHALPAMAEGAVFMDRIVAAVRASTGSFSGQATVGDHFRRHALIEAKLRSLPAIACVTDENLRKWRFGIINARINVAHQFNFFQAVRQCRDGIPAYSIGNMPPDFLAMLDALLEQCRPLEEEAYRQLDAAHAIFDEIAGAIPETAGVVHSALSQHN